LPSNLQTERDTFRRVEVIAGEARRRRWTAAEKARIVAESYAPGASGTSIALRYGLQRNQIFGKCRLRPTPSTVDYWLSL
jgi:transposase